MTVDKLEKYLIAMDELLFYLKQSSNKNAEDAVNPLQTAYDLVCGYQEDLQYKEDRAAFEDSWKENQADALNDERWLEERQ